METLEGECVPRRVVIIDTEVAVELVLRDNLVMDLLILHLALVVQVVMDKHFQHFLEIFLHSDLCLPHGKLP
tara:strand:- start:271 stop:486 length:216 start_codon:yes stop_codon:yes gene_type:complete